MEQIFMAYFPGNSFGRNRLFMCTSFVFRGAETVIGMNFDSNGMAFGVNTKCGKRAAVPRCFV